MAFFALNTKQGPGTELVVQAVDKAGNVSERRFPKHIKKSYFSQGRINLSEKFINEQLAVFSSQVPHDKDISSADLFSLVNNRLRGETLKTLSGLGRKTETKLLWKGSFLRLPRSSRKAAFGVSRIYRFKGKNIDNQVHLGIDLASVKQAPVPAANKGKVVFAGPLNIYGNTVVIDHGYGVMSTYSHLSRIDVATDQTVRKGKVIGRTGRTGLVGGDHLHFGIFIHNTFVNPVEWWDGSWIDNNIYGKIKYAKSKWD